MTNNRLHVDYSARYQGYIVTDSHGKQVFTNDGRPLVYSTKLDACRRIAQ